MSEENIEQMFDPAAGDPADTLWETKPWWCQPWSILLTGVVIPTGSWLVLHRLWITVPVAGAIALWWMLFLVLVPAQYAAAVKEYKEQNASA